MSAADSFRLNLLASGLTGASIMAATHPLDTAKCRWQFELSTSATKLMSSSSRTESFRAWARQILSQDGLWRGFWRPGLIPNCCGMVLAVGGRNGLYPTFRDLLGNFNDSQTKGVSTMFLSGLLAGCTGYFLGTPFLQLKTQMQTQNYGTVDGEGLLTAGPRAGKNPLYNDRMFTGLREIFSHQGGIRALWRGATPVVGRGASIAAFNFAGYDGAKTHCKKHNLLHDGPLLHVLASQCGALSCTMASMPFDVVLTTYTAAQSLGKEDRKKMRFSSPFQCAHWILRTDGVGAFFRGFVPALMRISPTVTSSFFVYEQLRRLVGIGYLD